MSKKKQGMYWLFAVLLNLSNHQALAQQDKWDLRRCVEYAYNNNISIKQADIDARVAKLSLEQSKWSQFGQASFSTSIGLNFGRSINPTTNLFTTNQSLYQNYSLQAGASLFNWFSLRRTIEANKYNYDAQMANIDKVKSDVALNVAAAYLTALLAREQVNVSSAKLQLTKQQLDITRKMVDAGTVPELNAAELEAQFATDTSTLISAQETYGINLLQLKAFLSLDAAVPFDLDNTPVESIPLEPIAELQPDLVYSLAEKSYPLQRMNDLRFAAAQKNVGAVKGQMFPTLSIFGGLGNSFNNELRQQIVTRQPDQPTNLYAVNNVFDTSIVYTPYATQAFVKQPFSKVFTGYGTQLDNNFRQQIGLSLNVPIFNGNLARTNFQKAKLNVQTVDLQRKNDLLTLKQNIYQAYNNAVAAMQKYEANKKAVSTAVRSFDLASKRYNIGLLNTIDYLTNQNNMFAQQINLLSSHYDFVFKMKVLEFYKGMGVKL